MKTIKSALFAVIALFAFTSASSASPLTGVYAELGTSAVGVSLDGTVTEADNTIPEITTGQIGKTAITVSYGLGYMTNRARTFGVDVGYMWNPGEAKIKSDTSDKNGNVNDKSNPNGSLKNIAGILNKEKNILGMMPHPERMIDKIISSDDGINLFNSLLN